MSLLKKASAIALTSAMALSLASCGKDTTWGANIDGTQLRAGLLIYFQSDAVSQAYNYMIETDTDVLAITIEDKPAKEWINDKAVEGMQEYVAVENKFNELGLTFENNEDKAASNTVDQWWEYIGEYFEGIGVSKQSYLDVVLNGEKRSAIFNYYYGEGGEFAVSDDEIKTYLSENNARINYIKMELRDGEGNLLKSDGKAEIKKMAEDYIERIKNGEDMNQVGSEYNEYYQGLIDAAKEASSETTEAADDEGTQVFTDNTTVISKTGNLPSAKVSEKVFDGTVNAGDVFLVEEDEVYYIVQKQDLFADESYLNNQREAVINTLKGEEFNSTVKSWIGNQTVELNDAAFERYKLEKLTKE